MSRLTLVLLLSAAVLPACSGEEEGGSGGTPAASECLSGKTAESGDDGPDMAPGEDCISCHSREGGPRYTVAGTVFAAPGEPDGCYGEGEVEVILTDADGVEVALTTRPSGNFYLPEGQTELRFPLTATVRTATGEREMLDPVQSGGCNGCHSETGSPGRIVMP